MPAGQPTKYKPEYCEKVIELMMEGASMVEVAYELRVHRDTVHEWTKVHPEFADAIKKAQHYSEGWWEKQGRSNLHNSKFNSALWYMNMKNRFGWRDKPKDEVSDDAKSLVEKLIDKL